MYVKSKKVYNLVPETKRSIDIPAQEDKPEIIML